MHEIERAASRDEGYDPDDPAVIAALDGVRAEAGRSWLRRASSHHLRRNEVAAYARRPPLPPWTLRARETQEVVMVGLPKPSDIQKMLDGFHKELRAIRTLLEQLLELERERIERDQAA